MKEDSIEPLSEDTWEGKEIIVITMNNISNIIPNNDVVFFNFLKYFQLHDLIWASPQEHH